MKNISPFDSPPETDSASGGLRILFYVFFPAGGIGKYSHHLASELARYKDLDVEMICLPEYQWADSGNYRTWAKLQSISSSIPAIRKFRFLKGQLTNPRILARRAKLTGAKVIHFCNVNHLSYPFWQSAIGPEVKMVATVHDVRRRSPILSRTWEDAQIRRFYQRCDALFVHGEGQAEDLARFAAIDPARIHIVPHGPHKYAPATSASVDRLRASYGVPAGRPVGLFFGYLRPEKNLVHLIRAMKIAKSGFQLVIAGDAGERYRDYLATVKSLVSESGLDSSVTFIDRYIRDEEVPDLFTLADWVAVPYDPSFSSQSGVLNVAAYYRRPSLVTPTPCFAETLQAAEVGYLCEGFSDSDLARGIDVLNGRIGAAHPYAFDLYQKLFSWEMNAELTRQVYRQICGKGDAGSSNGDSNRRNAR